MRRVQWRIRFFHRGKVVFIYSLRDPVSNYVRYIGKTKNLSTRLKKHIGNAKSLQTNHHCAHWIRLLLAQGLEPILEVVRCVQPGEDWQKAEMECIAEYRASGHPLTNMTAGGDGFHDVHPEILKKRGKSISAYRSLPENKAKLVTMMLEIGKRPEVRAARSAGVTAAWSNPAKRQRFLDGARTPTARRRKSEAMTKRNADPAHRERQSASLKSIWSTSARRAEATARAVAMHANPEHSARRVAAIKAAYQKPEVKVRLAAAMAEVNARPEVRAAKSARMKTKWENPEYRAGMHTAPVRAKMSARQSARASDPAERERLLTLARDPVRNALNAKLMTARNADPAFRAKVSDPEVRARAAATLKATWARRKAERAAML